MFAFAIWDKKEESLFIARDRVGKKPLFYSLTAAGNFVFGSELKTLLTHGEISREIDHAALDTYLTFGYVPEEFCIFKEAKKLAPGHFLVFKNGRVETQTILGFRLFRGRMYPVGRRIYRSAARKDQGGRQGPPDLRGAVGGFSLGRRRFLEHRRADVANSRQARQNILHRL